MDATLTAWLLAGGLAGAVASLVPGLHVNTLAALALAAGLWTPEHPVAPALLAALGASTITTAVPLVVLGVPEGEAAPALLPGQRMAREGQAGPALRASATGSLVGLLLALALALPLHALLTAPPARSGLSLAAPWVALAALAVLVLTDPAGRARALALAATAGLLGHLALALPTASPLGLPSSVLLPLFLGLFGLPALQAAAGAGPAAWGADDPGGGTGGRPHPLGPAVGGLLGLLAGLFPGFTTGPATAVAAQLRRTSDPTLMATTSAVNTAMACTATVALHALGRTRTGVHVAQVALGAPRGPADLLVADLAHLTLGVLAGLLVLRALFPWLDALSRHVPRLAAGLLVPWLVLVLAFTGWPGLLVAAAGWMVAGLAARVGTRRSLLMASLLVPTVVRLVGG